MNVDASFPFSSLPCLLPPPILSRRLFAMAMPKLPLLFFFILFFLASSLSARELAAPAKQNQSPKMEYHGGLVLHGRINVSIIWYGKFNSFQRAIVADLIASFSSTPAKNNSPKESTVATWLETLNAYYPYPKSSSSSRGYQVLRLVLGKQILDENYSLGKSLTLKQIHRLAKKGGHRHSISLVLTSSDVEVEGFCTSRCGTHGAVKLPAGTPQEQLLFVWVGNSATQCPGQCAWPFHQPIYGPQDVPLVAPNDVGMDGMVINLASLLAGAVTNPLGNGYYQGAKGAQLEAASACAGLYGKGASQGYPGQLLVDENTSGSYNAAGEKGRKYMLPALFNPATATCWTP